MPDPLLIWALQNATLPVAGTANKILPDTQLSNLGWDKGQKPSAQEFNYILNNLGTNLQQVISDLAALLPKRTFQINDFIRIPDVPGGLIIQWGDTSSFASGQSNVTFPTVFPNAPLVATANERVASSWGPTTTVVYGTAGLTNSNMAVLARTITGTAGPVAGAGLVSSWIAIGY